MYCSIFGIELSSSINILDKRDRAFFLVAETIILTISSCSIAVVIILKATKFTLKNKLNSGSFVTYLEGLSTKLYNTLTFSVLAIYYYLY